MAHNKLNNFAPAAPDVRCAVTGFQERWGPAPDIRSSMKKIEKSSLFDFLKQRYPAIRLYREDIEGIISCAESRGLKFKIFDDDHEFEDVDDLIQNKGSRVHRIKLEAKGEEYTFATLAVEIDGDGLLLKANKNDRLVPLWHEINDLLGRRIPWYAKYLSPYAWAWAWAGIILMVLSPRGEDFEEMSSPYKYAWLFVISCSLFLSIASLLYRKANRGLYLVRRHEDLGFFDRNWEKIALLLIGAVIGAGAKYAMELL